MLKLLYAGPTSACLELENDSPYFAPAPFAVTLDGQPLREETKNVFSLFGLRPGTDHTVGVTVDGVGETLQFKTAAETCAVNVKDFGAKGDGVTEDTEAIRAAVGCLPEGGRLYFPAGTYRTLPILLKSHMTLELSEGATLYGIVDRFRIPVIPAFTDDMDGGSEIGFGGFEGNAMPMYLSLITASYAEDIHIIGPGTLDGGAEESGIWKNFKEDPIARPRLLFLNRCHNVTVHGIEACNSPSWQLHPYYTDDIAFYGVHVSAPAVSPNTDALDPESCDHVDIIGCRFSVGDDCIAIKSGKIEMAGRAYKRADHHTIRNCFMESGHGAVVLGSELGCGIDNLRVEKCLFQHTDRGLRIKSRRGRGKLCDIKNVLFENIRMVGVLSPFVINLWYNCCDPDRFTEYVWSREKLPVDDRTPHMGSFTFRNITCEDTEVCACYVDGLTESPIESVTFENVSVSFAAECRPGKPAMQNFAEDRCRLGYYLDNVKAITMKHVSIKGAEGKGILTSHYETLNMEDFTEL